MATGGEGGVMEEGRYRGMGIHHSRMMGPQSQMMEITQSQMMGPQSQMMGSPQSQVFLLFQRQMYLHNKVLQQCVEIS